MSTRCTLTFTRDGKPAAKVYRHGDGYPDSNVGVLADLERFFSEVEKQAPSETRFNDPSYLAAKFVVWQADQNAIELANAEKIEWVKTPPLRFLGVGVVLADPEDIEFAYFVECGKWDAGPKVRPQVTWKAVRG